MIDQAAEQAFDESPYVGGDMGFDDLDELSPEEQALYDQEMEITNEVPEVAPVAAAEPEEPPVIDEPTPEPEITAEDVAEVEQLADESEAPVEPEHVPHETAEAPQEPQPAPSIPKARLDREIAKRRDLEQRLAEIEAGQKVTDNTQPDDTPLEISIDAEAITKALDMNLDGKNSEASALIADAITNAVTDAVQQTRSAMRSEVDAKVELGVTQAVGKVGAQTEAQTYEATVAQIETDYPIFNPDSDQFDNDLAGDVLAMSQGYQNRGYSPAEALSKAVESTLKLERPDLLKSNEAPAPAPAPEVNKGTSESRQRNAQVAQQQPSRQTGTGTAQQESKIDLENLTDEEFDALPESVLAEMRGDAM